MEDLQDIIGNILDEQDPVSPSLKAVISKLKKRNKLIKIVDSTEGGWAVVAEYEKKSIGSNSDDCKRIRQAETRALKKKDTEKSKSSAFKPSSTLRNPRIGQQFRNADFKHDNSPISSSSRQYLLQYRPNSYPQHPNSSQSWKPWCGTETADYCFGPGEQGHWRWTCPKENSHTTEDKIKGNNYNYFIEALHGNYGGEKKIGESGAYISVKGNLKKHLPFWEKTIRANETVRNILKNGYKLPFLCTPSNGEFKNNSSAQCQQKGKSV